MEVGESWWGLVEVVGGLVEVGGGWWELVGVGGGWCEDPINQKFS